MAPSWHGPLVEFCYKSDELGDPLVADDHIQLFGWATPQEVDEMVSYAIRINDMLTGLFYAIGFKLVDFKIEFGRLFRQTEQGEEMRVVLADEISPDSCRLWDVETGASFDKDRFRLDRRARSPKDIKRLRAAWASSNPTPRIRAIKSCPFPKRINHDPHSYHRFLPPWGFGPCRHSCGAQPAWPGV